MRRLIEWTGIMWWLVAQAQLPFWARGPTQDVDHSERSIEAIVLTARTPTALNYISGHLSGGDNKWSKHMTELRLLTYPPASSSTACVEEIINFEGTSDGSAVMEELNRLSPTDGESRDLAANALLDAILSFTERRNERTRVLVHVTDSLPQLTPADETRRPRTLSNVLHAMTANCSEYAIPDPRILQQAVESHRVYLLTVYIPVADEELELSAWRAFNNEALKQPQDFIHKLQPQELLQDVLNTLVLHANAWDAPFGVQIPELQSTEAVVETADGVLIKLLRRPQALHLEAEF